MKILQKLAGLVLLSSVILQLGACSVPKDSEETSMPAEKLTETAEETIQSYPEDVLFVPNDLYRSYFQLETAQFCDYDGDGTGDLEGVLKNLSLIANTGFTGISLGNLLAGTTQENAVLDFSALDGRLGTEESLTELLVGSHDYGMWVLMDFPMEATSVQHPWFQAAAEYLADLPEGAAPDWEVCPYINYYQFQKESAEGYIPVEGAVDWYYAGTEGNAKLNLLSIEVQTELEQSVAYWLDLGVDGFRLNYPNQYVENESDANLDVLTWFQSIAKMHQPQAFVVCDIEDSGDVYTPYYESGVDSFLNHDFCGQNGLIAQIQNGTQKPDAYLEKQTEYDTLCRQYNKDYIDAVYATVSSPDDFGVVLKLMLPGTAFVRCETEPNVGLVAGDPVLIFLKEILSCRTNPAALIRGATVVESELNDGAIYVLSREYENKKVFLLFHFSEDEVRINLESWKIQNDITRQWQRMLTLEGEAADLEGDEIVFPGKSVLIVQ